MDNNKKPQLTVISLQARKQEYKRKTAQTFEGLVNQVDKLTEKVYELHGRLVVQQRLIKRLLKQLAKDRKLEES